MKKLLALLLASLMIFALVACGADEKKEDKKETVEIASAVEILEKVWAAYGDEQKFFAMGGDGENPVDNAPGAFNIANAELLAAQLICNADAAAMIDSAASLFHAMNANTFTGAAYAIKEGSDAKAFITTMKTAIQGNQWMCGFPEKLLTATIGDGYVVVAFGNGEIIETFKGHLAAQYEMAEIEVEAIA